MRILADIPDEDLSLLNKLSKARRQPRAQLVRSAISAYLHAQSSEFTDAAFGLWSGRGKEDGLAYQDRLRGEW